MIKILNEQLSLVETKNYPYGKWKWDNFNPVQSRVFEIYDKDVNMVIASSTNSGKTVVAEMIAGHEIREKKKKVIYTAPLRALAQEKYDDWTSKDHHFSDLNIEIVTGDYKLTPEKKKSIEKADIIITTNEMLGHRCRHFKAEKNDFLISTGTLIFDEFHGISSPGRGVHAEVGLMSFTKINPECRLVLLSATMPNVSEIGEWASAHLNKKETYVISSSYRPTKLNIHFEAYSDDCKRYDDLEMEKVNKSLDIIEYYPDDKFILFVHTKRTGEILKKELNKIGIKAEFHNADLNKDSRVALEKSFKDGDLRVVIATSTISAGVNLPARRVIVVGVHRGLSEVLPSEVQQECGRAGRAGLDPAGDAYVLLPKSQIDVYKEKFKKSELINSRLLDQVGQNYKDLAFHLVSEIYCENISTLDDIHTWFKRSFAHFQAQELDDAIVDSTIDLLKKCGAVWEEDGTYTATSIGKISSLFYFSPFDVSDLKKNFNLLFAENKQNDDLWLSICLGNLDSQRMNIISRAEKDEIIVYVTRIRNTIGNRLFLTDPALKAGYCYFNLLNGNHSSVMSALQRNLQFDYDRLTQILKALDSMSGKWKQQKYFDILQQRIRHGVPEELLSLCSIPNVGKARAKKLYDKGIKNKDDFLRISTSDISKILNIKETKIKEMVESIN